MCRRVRSVWNRQAPGHDDDFPAAIRLIPLLQSGHMDLQQVLWKQMDRRRPRSSFYISRGSDTGGRLSGPSSMFSPKNEHHDAHAGGKVEQAHMLRTAHGERPRYFYESEPVATPVCHTSITPRPFSARSHFSAAEYGPPFPQSNFDGQSRALSRKTFRPTSAPVHRKEPATGERGSTRPKSASHGSNRAGARVGAGGSFWSARGLGGGAVDANAEAQVGEMGLREGTRDGRGWVQHGGRHGAQQVPGDDAEGGGWGRPSSVPVLETGAVEVLTSMAEGAAAIDVAAEGHQTPTRLTYRRSVLGGALSRPLTAPSLVSARPHTARSRRSWMSGIWERASLLSASAVSIDPRHGETVRFCNRGTWTGTPGESVLMRGTGRHTSVQAAFRQATGKKPRVPSLCITGVQIKAVPRHGVWGSATGFAAERVDQAMVRDVLVRPKFDGGLVATRQTPRPYSLS